MDAAHDKERKDNETIRNLKEEVASLIKSSEQQIGLSVNQEQT